MCQLVAVSTPSQHSLPHANQIVGGTESSMATKSALKRANVLSVYLEGELLIEDRIEGLPVDLGLKFLLLVRQ